MRRLIASAVAGLVLWTAAPAAATTVRDLKVEEMTRISTLVVRGTVQSQKTEWSADHRQILTHTTIRTHRMLKGGERGAVVVTQVGGTLDGRTMAIAGDARFQAGEEVIVFLEPHPTLEGRFVLVSMGAAKYGVRRLPSGEMVAERNLDGLAFVRPGADGVLRPGPSDAPASVPLETLLQQVQPKP